jgi:hypothetical protein
MKWYDVLFIPRRFLLFADSSTLGRGKAIQALHCAEGDSATQMRVCDSVARRLMQDGIPSRLNCVVTSNQASLTRR